MSHENLLEELYYGNIRPYAKCFERDSGYAALIKIISDNEEKLIEFLKAAKEEANLFSQMMNALNEVLAFSEREQFIEGFQLGAKFMMDACLIPRNSVLQDIC